MLARQMGFPEPEAVFSARRILRGNIEEWAKATGRTMIEGDF